MQRAAAAESTGDGGSPTTPVGIAEVPAAPLAPSPVSGLGVANNVYPSISLFTTPPAVDAAAGGEAAAAPQWGGFHAPLPPSWALMHAGAAPAAYATAGAEMLRLLAADDDASAGASPRRNRPSPLFPPVAADYEKAGVVRAAMMHAWSAYASVAWGSDTLRPLSRTADNGFLGMACTLVDGLSTLAVMGEADAFAAGASWVGEHLLFDHQEDVNTFETTIRVVGGLLSAWHLDGRSNPSLLAKAGAAADALSIAFDSPTGLPYGTLGLRSKRKYNPGVGSSISEVATLQVELEALTAATGVASYAVNGRRAMAHLQAAEPVDDSLWPMYISPDTGAWGSTSITLGARGDSTYEYLLKQAVLAGLLGGGGGGRGGSGTLGNPGLLPRHNSAGGGEKEGAAAATASSAVVDTSAWALPPTTGASSAYAAAGRAPALLAAYAAAAAATTTPANATGSTDGRGGVSSNPGLHLLGASANGYLAHKPVSPASEAAWFASLYGMYLRSVAGVEAHLLRSSSPGNFDYIGERHGGVVDGKVDHLTCFVPGMLALGSLGAPTDALAIHQLDLARRLMRTCVRMYEMTPTGLAPEITRFYDGGDPVADPGAKHNLLRPETLESLFVLYRVTGEQTWRDAGWAIFSSFMKHCRVEGGGFATLRDVTVNPPEKTDQQESFFLAETLKYAFLLFSDGDLLPLDEWVFNTEAHPVPIWGGAAAAEGAPSVLAAEAARWRGMAAASAAAAVGGEGGGGPAVVAAALGDGHAQ